MKQLLILCLLCGLAATASADTFYRWQDAAGVTHYSERPPSDVGSEDVTVSDYQPSSHDAATRPTTNAATSASSQDNIAHPDTNAVQQACDGYRKNLALLQSDKNLVTPGKDGKQQLLSKEQREEMTARAIEALKSCAPAAN